MTIFSKILNSPYLALTMVPLIWGSNFIIAKQLVKTLPPFALTTGRFAVAFLCLLPLFLYYRTKHPVKKMSAKTWGVLIFLGITGVFAFNTLLYAGLKQTSPVNATLINAFNPTLTILLSIFILGEKLRGQQIIGLILSFIGVVWIAVQGQLDKLSNLAINQGDLFILGGALAWAIYSIWVKKVVPIVSPLVITTFSMFFGLLLLFPATYIESTFQPAGPLTWKSVLALIYLGIFPSVIAFLLWNRGIAQVGPGKASMFYNLLPLFVAIMSYLVWGEIPQDYHLIGGTMILFGVFLGTK
ncbi:MAG: DMT family transporter [Clostridia bacterium]|nr:DMT family transporter [Clostridia bacterium]